MAFTVEEITFLNNYKARSKDDTIVEIKKIIPYINDENMQELAADILNKLENISDSEFQTLNFDDVLETNESDYIL